MFLLVSFTPFRLSFSPGYTRVNRAYVRWSSLPSLLATHVYMVSGFILGLNRLGDNTTNHAGSSNGGDGDPGTDGSSLTRRVDC